MAHIFKRPGSRFWWVQYRDPATGKITRKSLGIDWVADDSRRDAELEALKWKAKELAAPKSNEAERWETWAGPFIEAKYAGTGSLKNARRALLEVLAYFKVKGIRTPRQVDYDIAAGFVPWRISGALFKKIAVNSALLRFVYFSVLMSEAVKRKFCEFNHCLQVRTKRGKAKEKHEITRADQTLIENTLATKPEWMRDCWHVLMCQGCRIAECAVPLDRIDTDMMTITFRLKGGKLHTAALHPDLLPLIRKAIAQKRTCLVEGPPVGSWSSSWSAFFTKLTATAKQKATPGYDSSKFLSQRYSIHCTRVTAITRMVRQGHQVTAICNFIGHGEEVNKIYRKLKPADSQELLKSLGGVSIPE